ncbi:MAG: hypothetical protein ACOC95_07130 [Planctomycetota bacterium]
MARFTCPNCNETIEIDGGPGATAACPACGTTVQAPAAPPSAPAPGAPKSAGADGLAIAALVLGILAVVPVLGLLAVLPALIVSLVALTKNRPGRGFAIAGLALSVAGGLMALLVISILLPALGRAKQMAKATICASHLQNIGQSVMIYQMDNRDTFPPDLSILSPEGYIDDPETLQCPAAPSSGGGGYFYVAPQMSAELMPSPSTTILACDRRGNHGDLGRNVLFADGHVELLREPEFQTLLGGRQNADFAAALRAAEGP